MTLQSLRALGLAGLALAVGACAGPTTSELSGKVTYKGAPLATGEVHVLAANGVEVSGEIKPDGTYVIPNVPRGTHQVRVFCVDEKMSTEYFTAVAGRGKGEPIGPDGKVRPKGSPILDRSAFSKIPAKYGDYAKSNLSVEVKDAKATKNFDLVD